MTRITLALAVCVSALAAGFAAAAPTTEVTHYTIEGGGFSLTECLGSTGTRSSSKNVTYRITVVRHTDAEGTSFFVPVEIWTGTGTDGVTYHGSTTFRQATRVDAKGTTHFDYVGQSRVVGPGTAGNYIIHQRFRATQTADGTFTIHQDSIMTTCSAPDA